MDNQDQGYDQISRADLDLIKEKMNPSFKPHNLIDIVELFPDHSHIHYLFRQISVHYESPTLTYEQINAYMLSSLAKYNQDTLYGRKIKIENKSQRLRLKDPESEDGVKVCMLKNIGDN